MRFAKRVFLIAGIYGITVLAPQLFMERRIGVDHPPSITHPEYFYGFLSVALAWQILFILISREPVRLRAVMLTCILEKLGFTIAVPILYLQGRASGTLLPFAAIDGILAMLFAVAYIQTPSRR